MTWQDRAAKIVANSLNPDWQKSGYTQLPEVYDIPLVRYDENNKPVTIGIAKAVAFQWTSVTQSSFVGFLVIEFAGAFDSTPIINQKGTITPEKIQEVFYSAGLHLVNRYCPRCSKFDTLKRTRQSISCRCGFRERLERF